MSKHFDKLAYQLDRLQNVCPDEVLAWLRAISESDGALYANATMLASLGCSPLENAALANLKMRVLRRGRVSSFDLSCLEIIIRCRRAFHFPTSDLELLRRKWSKKASKKDRQNLKVHAADYRKIILEWLEKPSRTKTERRDKALFALLIFVPLRINTVHLLQKSHFDGGILYVPAEYMKGRRSISPRLPSISVERITEYLLSRRDDNPALFATAGGGEIALNSLQRAIRRRTKKLLGTELGPHDFRRIVATTASAVSPDTAAALLVISVSILRKSYDLNDSTDRINHALARIGV